MKLIDSIINTIDKINDWVGKICSYSVVVLLVVVVYEVAARRVFSSPTIWAQEMTTFIYGFLIMMVLAYGLVKGSHVCVDLFTASMSVRNRHILSIVMYLILFFPFVTVMVYASYGFVSMSWAMQEASWSQWAPPVYPIKTVIPIALILLWLQGFSETLKSIRFLKTGRHAKLEEGEGEV